MRARPLRGLAPLALILASTATLSAQDNRGKDASTGRPAAPRSSATAQPGRTSPAAPGAKSVGDPDARKAATQVPKAKPVDPEGVRRMDEILRKWEAKSATIRSLTAKYTRTDVSPLFDSKKVYTGQALFTSDSKAFIDFYDVTDPTNKKPPLDERIICDGEKVYQFKGPTQQIFIFPLPKNGKQKALQQGPLPFLFNMKAGEAKKRYDMELMGTKDNCYVIRIIPLLEIDQEEYSQAWLKLSMDELRPVDIRLYAQNGKDTKNFAFDPKALVENQEIPAKWFDAARMAADAKKLGWKIIDNPETDGRARRDPAPAPAPAIGARPATGKAATSGQGAVRQK